MDVLKKPQKLFIFVPLALELVVKGGAAGLS
jgi:hypothetical protein